MTSWPKVGHYTPFIIWIKQLKANQNMQPDTLSQDERQTAKSRWDDLKVKIMWQSKHYRDLDNLKNFRLDIAHLENVDLMKLNEFIEKAFGKIHTAR